MTSFSTHVLALATSFLFLPACGATQPPEPSPVPAPAAVTTPPPESTTPVAASSGAPEAASAAVPETPAAPSPAASVEPVAPVASSSRPPGRPGKEKPSSANHTLEAAPAAPAASVASGDTPPTDACTTKNFHYSQIGSACHSGGRKAAKEVMKGVVKKAKASGADLKCGSCHEDLNTFHLKANAVTDLKQWL